MTAPLLSVVAISKNESEDMPGFIEHLLPLVDEIIIVDDRSIDNSADLARQYDSKVKVYTRSMTDEGGFAEQRNYGIKQASGDWVLNMDIDERVSPELWNEIQVSLQSPMVNAFKYRRVNYFLHRPMRGSGWNTWNRAQLARRDCHHFEGKIHEEAVVTGGEGFIGQLGGYMYHINDSSYEERLRKSGQYTLIEAKKTIAEGRRIRAYHILLVPFVEFLKVYFYKKGFKDGIPGLILAMHSATAVFRKFALAWDVQNHIPRKQIEEEIKEAWRQH
ncbi:MAG: glycosyltransferase family 2 protein [bacterium]